MTWYSLPQCKSISRARYRVSCGGASSPLDPGSQGHILDICGLFSWPGYGFVRGVYRVVSQHLSPRYARSRRCLLDAGPVSKGFGTEGADVRACRTG
jgi:hypothetical protein